MGKEILAFQRARDGKCLLFQIEPDNRVTFISADGTEQGSTRPLGSPEQAKSFIVNYAKTEGFNEPIEVRIPEKILRSS